MRTFLTVLTVISAMIVTLTIMIFNIAVFLLQIWILYLIIVNFGDILEVFKTAFNGLVEATIQ